VAESSAQVALDHDFDRPNVQLAVTLKGHRYGKEDSWAWGWGGAILRFYGDAKPPCEIQSWVFIQHRMNLMVDTDEAWP
jgi:hypothetical protein